MAEMVWGEERLWPVVKRRRVTASAVEYLQSPNYYRQSARTDNKPQHYFCFDKISVVAPIHTMLTSSSRLSLRLENKYYVRAGPHEPRE